MRMKILKIVVVLLLSGSGDARPQKIEESSLLESSKTNPDERQPSSVPETIGEDSRAQSNDTRRNLKDLQHIDQSLRTVATQLLNVSNSEEPAKILDNVIKKPALNQRPIDATPIKETTANSNGQSANVGFRPINSKFNYFETSHPGHAMAITEEELEKEMSSTRLMTAYKNHPTTTGGISTWILLNPPTTTMKTPEVEKKTKQPSAAEVRTTVKATTMMERIDTTERITEKVTMPISNSIIMEEPPTTKKSVLDTTKKHTELKAQKVQTTEKVAALQVTTLEVPQTTASSVESKEAVASTTKKVHVVRTTAKPKPATQRTTVLSKNSVSKVSRPNQQSRPKVSIRRTTVKPDIVKNENATTAKVEKVTFRPIQTVSASKSKIESTEKPMFVTKIKASILMDTQKITMQPPAPSTTALPLTTTSKTVTVHKGPAEVSVKVKPVATKVNNVLKVQLKKPLADSSKIETEPVKINADKVEKDLTKKEQVEKETESLDDSTIDLMKFDFNPELTKINVNTETKESSSTTAESSTTSSTTSAATTKKPRNSLKRKKNKGRRRKPSTSTTTTTTASPLIPTSTETELMVAEAMAANGIQESKIVPETKIATNLTKTKKKPGTTPITMKIYNYLSREVMPSFGVMSLVGLGLGLASYFLYPFGGTITRRNYDLEPKYKYNFDEYGGNYGQNEEEVLSKVLQGMTTDETKYPGSKDYDNNYYRYQHYDGAYEQQTTKRNDIRYPSSSPMYRPENTNSALKYKNTDYRYPDTPSTPNYYERPKHAEYVVGQTVPGSVNRQFVVGSVPKDYPSYEKEMSATTTSGKLNNNYKPTESGQVLFDHNINQRYNFPAGSVQNYGQVQTARPEETYEEVEITPTAVAVEHGPRALKIKRSSLDLSTIMVHNSRRKRDSVIQVIPSKRELEEEEKEEDLSNEILNIIDSALPGEDEYNYTKKNKQENEVDDSDIQRKKHKKEEEEERIRLKESTTESETVETSTASSSSLATSAIPSATSAATKGITDPPTATNEVDFESTTTSNSKVTEETTVESIDSTTKMPTEQNGFNIFNFVKKIAEIKFRLGLTLLKHASEGFAKYLGHVQKRINGEE